MSQTLEIIKEYWWVLPLALCIIHCVFGSCCARANREARPGE